MFIGKFALSLQQLPIKICPTTDYYPSDMSEKKKQRYLIVGGVAGGATAAARMRRLTEEAEIVLFEKGAYISYANCGLPYYIGGVIGDRERLFVQTPEAFGKRFNIDVGEQRGDGHRHGREDRDGEDGGRTCLYRDLRQAAALSGSVTRAAAAAGD